MSGLERTWIACRSNVQDITWRESENVNRSPGSFHEAPILRRLIFDESRKDTTMRKYASQFSLACVFRTFHFLKRTTPIFPTFRGVDPPRRQRRVWAAYLGPSLILGLAIYYILVLMLRPFLLAYCIYLLALIGVFWSGVYLTRSYEWTSALLEHLLLKPNVLNQGNTHNDGGR